MAPAVMGRPPTSSQPLSFSPSSVQAKSMTSGTLMVDLSPKLRQANKTQFSVNGELW